MTQNQTEETEAIETEKLDPTPETTATEVQKHGAPLWVRSVIFLDWDGVLIFRDGRWSREAMEELNRLCFETGAAVVLTTSFRYSGSVRALHGKMLEHGFDPMFPFWAKPAT